MKFLRHLLTGAVCVVVLTTATVSAQLDENVSKQLRGTDGNYDNADLFPSPEDNDNDAEPDENEDEGVLPPGAGDDEYENGPGEEQLIPAESEESDGELPLDTISDDELDVAEETDDEVIDVEDVGEVDLVDQETFYVRRLRSSFDPHGQIQVDEPVPIIEVVTPPSSVTNVKSVNATRNRASVGSK